MNSEGICSEEEAIRIAGVSSRTLLRFSEAGYLRLSTAPDGSRMYERTQVEEIFGVTSQPPYPVNHHVPPTVDTRPILDATEAMCSHPRSELRVEPGEVRLEGAQQQCGAAVATESGVANHTADGQVDNSGDELARLRNLLAIQERILDSKDDEIADLRSQRAWLRERIERLEEKSDRDQILLLSETQTIRSLIAYRESRKSVVRQFLEWTGLVKEEHSASLPQPQASDYHSQPAKVAAGSRTIEVSKAANSD